MRFQILIYISIVTALATRPPVTNFAELLLNYALPTPTAPPPKPAPSTPTVTASTSRRYDMSALVTIAPLSKNPLELRQRCFDDRGFSVDCATWTGYYYTWGGEGHPYAGGPGDDGGNGGGGSGFNYVGKASSSKTAFGVAAAMALLTWILLLAF